MMNIHNVGFYDINPLSINRMSYEPTFKKLALSRSNNMIEIWNLSECPIIERIIPGKSNSSVESLVWCNTRLFSTGLHGFIVEYNFSTLKHKKWSIPSGPAWCLDIDKKKTRLAVGTDLGHINIFNIYDDDIVFEKILDKQEGRIICIKWQNKNHLVTGSIDSIRVWNVKTGQAIDKITTGRNAAKKETVVWCLEVTDDFTIISGDSRGTLSFWDGKMGTLIESFQTHIADILCLCLSEDHNTIYCSGADPVISCFSRISVNKKIDKVKWVKSSQNKVHDHDVNALCLKEKTVISGGVSSYLNFNTYNPKSYAKYPPFLQGSPASISNECRQILLRHHTHLELWELGVWKAEHNELSNNTTLNLKKNPTKLLHLDTCGNDLILCSDISQNGKWLAYSTPTQTKLYSISQGNEKLIPTKATNSRGPSIKLAFAGDKLALVTLKGKIIIIEASLDFKPDLIKLDIYRRGLLKDNVTHLIFSNDYLVVSDHLGNIVVWSTFDWTLCGSLPKYECPPTAMAINPQTKNLVIAYSDLKITEYSLERRHITSFSKHFDPIEWFSRKHPIQHIVFDPRNPDIILLNDDNTICIINKNQMKTEEPWTKKTKTEISNYTINLIDEYKHITYMNWIKEDNELLIIEVNSSDLFKKLPPAIKRKRFGI